MTAERCERTELLVEQCACPAHRAGHAPGEEPIETTGQSFAAIYGGGCARSCDHGISPGDRIVRCWDGYVHAGRCPTR